MGDVGHAVLLAVVHREMREELVPGILHDVPREQLGVGMFLPTADKVINNESSLEDSWTDGCHMCKVGLLKEMMENSTNLLVISDYFQTDFL